MVMGWFVAGINLHVYNNVLYKNTEIQELI